MFPRFRLPLVTAAFVALTIAPTTAAHAAVAAHVSFTSKPSAVSSVTNPTLAFAATTKLKANSTYCRLDTGAWRACASPWRAGNLRVGAHTAYVRAKTSTGKTLTASYQWAYILPAPALDGISPTWEDASSQTVTASSPVAGVHYVYKLNGGAPTTSSGSFSVQTQGATTVSVSAVDTTGNHSAATVGAVKLDTGAPDMSALPLPAWTDHIAIPLSVVTDAGSGVKSVSWTYRNGTDWSETSSQVLTRTLWSVPSTANMITVPTDGAYQFKVTATDNLGHQSSVTFYEGQDSSWTPAPAGAPAAPTAIGGSGFDVVMHNCTTMSLDASQLTYTQIDNSYYPDFEIQASIDGGRTWSPSALGAAPAVNSPMLLTLRARVRNTGGTLWSDWSPITNQSIQFSAGCQ